MNYLKNMDEKKKKGLLIVFMIAGAALLAYFTLNFAYATDYKSTIKDLVDKLVGIIGTIFIAIGVILAAYSVGQLVLAFKNEDADSKSRATTMLVVSVVLIAAPSIINGLNLTDKIMS